MIKILIGILVLYVLFAVWCLCTVAARADRELEKYIKQRKAETKE